MNIEIGCKVQYMKYGKSVFIVDYLVSERNTTDYYSAIYLVDNLRRFAPKNQAEIINSFREFLEDINYLKKSLDRVYRPTCSQVSALIAWINHPFNNKKSITDFVQVDPLDKWFDLTFDIKYFNILLNEAKKRISLKLHQFETPLQYSKDRKSLNFNTLESIIKILHQLSAYLKPTHNNIKVLFNTILDPLKKHLELSSKEKKFLSELLNHPKSTIRNSHVTIECCLDILKNKTLSYKFDILRDLANYPNLSTKNTQTLIEIAINELKLFSGKGEQALEILNCLIYQSHIQFQQQDTIIKTYLNILKAYSGNDKTTELLPLSEYESAEIALKELGKLSQWSKISFKHLTILVNTALDICSCSKFKERKFSESSYSILIKCAYHSEHSAKIRPLIISACLRLLDQRLSHEVLTELIDHLSHQDRRKYIEQTITSPRYLNFKTLTKLIPYFTTEDQKKCVADAMHKFHGYAKDNYLLYLLWLAKCPQLTLQNQQTLINFLLDKLKKSSFYHKKKVYNILYQLSQQPQWTSKSLQKVTTTTLNDIQNMCSPDNKRGWFKSKSELTFREKGAKRDCIKIAFKILSKLITHSKLLDHDFQILIQTCLQSLESKEAKEYRTILECGAQASLSNSKQCFFLKTYLDELKRKASILRNTQNILTLLLQRITIYPLSIQSSLMSFLQNLTQSTRYSIVLPVMAGIGQTLETLLNEVSAHPNPKPLNTMNPDSIASNTPILTINTNAKAQYDSSEEKHDHDEEEKYFELSINTPPKKNLVKIEEEKEDQYPDNTKTVPTHKVKQEPQPINPTTVSLNSENVSPILCKNSLFKVTGYNYFPLHLQDYNDLLELLNQYRHEKQQTILKQNQLKLINTYPVLKDYYESFQCQLNNLLTAIRALVSEKIEQSVPLLHLTGISLLSKLADKLHLPGAGLVDTALEAGYRYKEKSKNNQLVTFFPNPSVQYQQIEELARFLAIYYKPIFVDQPKKDTLYSKGQDKWAHLIGSPINTSARRRADADIEKLMAAILEGKIKSHADTIEPLLKIIIGKENFSVHLNHLLKPKPKSKIHLSIASNSILSSQTESLKRPEPTPVLPSKKLVKPALPAAKLMVLKPNPVVQDKTTSTSAPDLGRLSPIVENNEVLKETDLLLIDDEKTVSPGGVFTPFQPLTDFKTKTLSIPKIEKNRTSSIHRMPSSLADFNTWYSTEAVTALLHQLPNPARALRYVFFTDAKDACRSFLNQLHALSTLQTQLKRPIVFITTEPAPFAQPHFILGVKTSSTLLLINPTGQTTHSGFYNALKIAQNRQIYQHLLLSTNIFQHDPKGVVSCGAWCLTLAEQLLTSQKLVTWTDNLVKQGQPQIRHLHSSQNTKAKEFFSYYTIAFSDQKLLSWVISDKHQYKQQVLIQRQLHANTLKKIGELNVFINTDCLEQSLIYRLIGCDIDTIQWKSNTKLLKNSSEFKTLQARLYPSQFSQLDTIPNSNQNQANSLESPPKKLIQTQCINLLKISKKSVATHCTQRKSLDCDTLTSRPRPAKALETPTLPTSLYKDNTVVPNHPVIRSDNPAISNNKGT